MLLLRSTFRALVTLRRTPIWNRVLYHYFERELLDILDLTCTLCIEYILVFTFFKLLLIVISKLRGRR